MEWHKMYYNGLETNIECTMCGKVRRIKVDWSKGKNVKIGEVNWLELKTNNKGYHSIPIKVKGYVTNSTSIHQLIYATFNPKYKFKTKLKVDHIDSNKKNNNINNLQLIDNRENISKSAYLKKTTNLPIGVFKVCLKYKEKKYIYYRAGIRLENNKNTKHLGNFKTPEEASEAYQKKLKEIKQIQYENLSSNKQ